MVSAMPHEEATLSEIPPPASFIPEATLDALPFPALLYRTDGLLVGYNRAAEDFWGISREQVVNKFNMLETPEILEESMVKAMQAAVAGQTSIVPAARIDVSKSTELSTVSQKSAWVENIYIPLRDAGGVVRYVLILNKDVTELVEKRVAVEEAKSEIAEQRELIERLEAAQREIEEQRETILALESPIIEVGEGILLLPVIGAVSERRAADMMDKALSSVVASRARYLILDLTGSEHIDTTTANHFSNIVRAIALLGAQGIIVGIKPQVAQTMTSLGLDLSGAFTYRNLREALARCAREIAKGPR